MSLAFGSCSNCGGRWGFRGRFTLYVWSRAGALSVLCDLCSHLTSPHLASPDSPLPPKTSNSSSPCKNCSLGLYRQSQPVPSRVIWSPAPSMKSAPSAHAGRPFLAVLFLTSLRIASTKFTSLRTSMLLGLARWGPKYIFSSPLKSPTWSGKF